MQKWSLIDVDDALELLSKQFTNTAVRKYAVSRLREANDEVYGCLILGADQFLSDRRGADFPGGGECIGALPKKLLGFRSFKNTLYR